MLLRLGGIIAPANNLSATTGAVINFSFGETLAQAITGAGKLQPSSTSVTLGTAALAWIAQKKVFWSDGYEASA
jgi:hypothetical protein